MGSLTSRPSIPAPQPRVVFVPAPPAPVPDISAEDTKNDSTPESSGQIQSTVRTANLLRRSRGRAGTVRTGFRGLLELAAANGHRKTLLGE